MYILIVIIITIIIIIITMLCACNRLWTAGPLGAA
jgi:hypothetical protein